MKQKTLIVSAPSGAGKTTVVRKFLALAPGWRKVVTCTTRSPRPEEKDGTDYRFFFKETFNELASQGAFVEHAVVYGHGYGTLRDDLFAIWAENKGAVLILDTQGKKTVAALVPDAVSVFLRAPSREEQERRIRTRGTDSEESIRKRLEESETEMTEAAGYSHILVNEDSDATARRLVALAESMNADGEPDFG